MSDAFLGEIRAFGFNYAPQDWAFCWGQQYSVAQYQALYTIIGNLYGGSPQQHTFNVPDLRGRITAGTGTAAVSGISDSFKVAQVQGESTATCSNTNMPSHTHQAVSVQVKADLSAGPVPDAYVSVPRLNGNTVYDAWIDYQNRSQSTTLQQESLTVYGGNAAGMADAHSNVSPYLAMNFCICMNGDFYPVRD